MSRSVLKMAAWLLCLGILLGATLATKAQGDSMLNQSRPAFTLPDLDGTPRSISEWDGKMLVINFWASWCKPCLREMPAFTRLQQHYRDQGVQFIGVALDDVRDVTAFLDRLEPRINYPILLGDGNTFETPMAYGNQYGILPHTVIVDKYGKIAYTHFGSLTYEQGHLLLMGMLL
ncbi:MAG: TlpA family protein disulfide reductase [Gammaproteobacteria bacterium]|nr:TlpA family protein disulfide reductase [Gammaproteobacteria bacterium]